MATATATAKGNVGLRDWLNTGVAVGGTFASLLTFDVLQRLAILAGEGTHQRVVSGMAKGIVLSARLGGTRVRAEGLENAVPGQNYVIVSNHQSLLDIAMTSDFLDHLRPRYVSKLELARGVPGVSYNLRRGGSALIDRKDARQATEAIAELGRRVARDHWTAVIFPEGTRSKTGAMKPFRESGLRTLIANAPGIPVLPVTTGGGSRLFRHNLKPLVRGVELVYRVHPAVRAPDPADAEAFRAFVRSLEETIRSGLPEEDRAAEAEAPKAG